MRGSRLLAALGAAAFFASLAQPADAAGRKGYQQLAGKWCGEVSSYTFTRGSLVVDRIDGTRRILPVARFETGPNYVLVHWKDKRADGNPNTTLFEKFSADGTEMQQAANTGGDNGPGYIYRRC